VDKHLYLVTIACEGGLPLLLLRKENASLYRYFKNLLQTYHRERGLLNCDVVSIAKRLASYLPKNLQQKIVYKLGGELVKQVVELQQLVPDAADPIIALDKKRPDWRDVLPLPLRNSTAELLLKNLVNEAKTLTISERQRIQWRRLLFDKDDYWWIEQSLELPNQFSGAALRSWMNAETLIPRLRILLQTTIEITPIALLTRLYGDGDEAGYRCEELRRKGVKTQGGKIIGKPSSGRYQTSFERWKKRVGTYCKWQRGMGTVALDISRKRWPMGISAGRINTL
jgi:hypothetical protein